MRACVMRASTVAAAATAVVVVLLAAAAVEGGSFKRARTIGDCQTCVEHGYGWCPRRRRCGFFKNKVCTGTSTDYSADMLAQDLTDENYNEALYDERRISFVWFHSEFDKAQAAFTINEAVKLFGKADSFHRERTRFFTVNHDRFPDIARRHGVELSPSLLPTMVALEAVHKPQPEWRDWPAFMVARHMPFISRTNHRTPRTPDNLVAFVMSVLEASSARIPEVDALVPRFMAAVLGNGGNATEVYLEAQQVVADVVGELVAKTEEAAAELERQRKEFEAKEAAKEADGEATDVTVTADGNTAGEATEAADSGGDTKEGEKEALLLDTASLARLRTVQTGSPTLYLSAMELILNSGYVPVVREVNDLRLVDTPRPTPVRHRLEVLEVFVNELF